MRKLLIVPAIAIATSLSGSAFAQNFLGGATQGVSTALSSGNQLISSLGSSANVSNSLGGQVIGATLGAANTTFSNSLGQGAGVLSGINIGPTPALGLIP